MIPWLEATKAHYEHVAHDSLDPGVDAERALRVLALIAIAEAAQSFKPRTPEDYWVTDNYDGGDLKEAVAAAERVE